MFLDFKVFRIFNVGSVFLLYQNIFKELEEKNDNTSLCIYMTHFKSFGIMRGKALCRPN